MQICIARMLQESGIFFAVRFSPQLRDFCGRLTYFQLLSILGAGFAQGLYALDASDQEAGSPSDMIHLLVQALLQYGLITESFFITTLNRHAGHRTMIPSLKIQRVSACECRTLSRSPLMHINRVVTTCEHGHSTVLRRC
jgi:hypothetical protein